MVQFSKQLKKSATDATGVLAPRAALDLQALDQCFGGHLPEILIAPGTHGDHPSGLFLFADDDEVGPLQ